MNRERFPVHILWQLPVSFLMPGDGYRMLAHRAITEFGSHQRRFPQPYEPSSFAIGPEFGYRYKELCECNEQNSHFVRLKLLAEFYEMIEKERAQRYEEICQEHNAFLSYVPKPPPLSPPPKSE